MRKIFFYIITYCFAIQSSFAEEAWIFGTSITWEELRTWDIHADDIPGMIMAVISFWIWIAWTIAIIFIIYWAYQILFSEVTWWDKSKWKGTISSAIIWFTLALLSWFIVQFVMENLENLWS
jgi:hypothetical protein